MIKVSNPEHYIDLKKNRIGKMAMRANYDKFGFANKYICKFLKN